MDLNLAGRTVLVTGGSKGIGFACAAAFAAEGARVAISSRNLDNLAAASKALEGKGGEVATIAADLSDPKSAAATGRPASRPSTTTTGSVLSFLQEFLRTSR